MSFQFLQLSIETRKLKSVNRNLLENIEEIVESKANDIAYYLKTRIETLWKLLREARKHDESKNRKYNISLFNIQIDIYKKISTSVLKK